MDYARIMAALRRRRWLILAVVLTTTIATGLATFRMKREYAASATLMAHEGALDPLPELGKTNTEGRTDDKDIAADRLKTVATVLGSPAIVGRVIQQNGLKTTPDLFMKQTDVQELTSRLVRISYRDTDPQKAVRVVNSTIHTFVDFYKGLRTQEARAQLASVTEKRADAERALQLASSRLQDFESQTSMDPTLQNKELLTRATQAEQERNAAEARLREVSAQVATQEALLARTPRRKELQSSSTQAEVVGKVQLERNEVAKKLAELKAKYTDDHPAVIAAMEEMRKADERLEEARSKPLTITSNIPNPEWDAVSINLRELRRDRDGFSAKVASLNAKVSRLQGEIAGLSGVDVQHSLLSQQQTLAQQQVAGLVARQQQLQMALGVMDRAPLAIVDEAGGLNPPVDLSRGRTLKLSALAFVLSLAACIALTLALEMSDRRVRSVEDVEALTQLPVVSVVPALPGRATAANLCLTAEHDPASHLAESYHFLANHVLRQTFQRDSTVIMGVTARPGQGATTALSNLAVALARAGRQVVLVEADLRRPFLHEPFGSGGNPGLTDVLQDRVSVQNAVYPTQINNLRLMPAGSAVLDPWSLLWQPNVRLTIQALRETADYVIFNVPSATVFADALCIAPHADGAILVMRTSEMPNGAEAKVRQWLDEVNVPVMGVVLNGVPSKQMETFEFHRSYTTRGLDTARPALNPPSVPPVPVRDA